MTSWKPSSFLGRSFFVGDEVELRDRAERGLEDVYRVRTVTPDGDLHLELLERGSASGTTTLVSADDVHAFVFAVRPEVRARCGC